ncbi:MAG: hypothetical protein JW973_01785 [Bacteroidales bacterium]|nr:hypothetical protein [Bacteroidales bacterium]
MIMMIGFMDLHRKSSLDSENYHERFSATFYNCPEACRQTAEAREKGYGIEDPATTTQLKVLTSFAAEPEEAVIKRPNHYDQLPNSILS